MTNNLRSRRLASGASNPQGDNSTAKGDNHCDSGCLKNENDELISPPVVEEDQRLDSVNNKTSNLHNEPYQRDDLDEQTTPSKDDEKNKQAKSHLAVVRVTYFNVILYSCCFCLQHSVFPYLAKRMGADPVTFGYMQTTFDLLQLAGSLLFGRLDDLFGSRLALTLAFSAAASSSFLLYSATTIPILFLSRLPSVFMHAYQGSQIIMMESVGHTERANALARLGISFELGIVSGRLLCGVASSLFSLETSPLVACIGSLINVLLVNITIPPRVVRTKTTPEPGKESLFSASKLVEILSGPGTLFLMFLKVCFDIPNIILQKTLCIIALETFNLPADKNCYLLSYIGVLSILVQWVGVRLVTKRFSELAILAGSAVLMCVSYLMLSSVTSVWQMCIVFLPLVTGMTFQTVITTSALTNTVSDNNTGVMIGLIMSMTALVRVFSTTIGGYMLGTFGFASFGYLGFGTSIFVTVVLAVRLSRGTKIYKESEVTAEVNALPTNLTNKESELKIEANEESDLKIEANEESELKIVANEESELKIAANEKSDFKIVADGDTESKMVTNGESGSKTVAKKEACQKIILQETNTDETKRKKGKLSLESFLEIELRVDANKQTSSNNDNDNNNNNNQNENKIETDIKGREEDHTKTELTQNRIGRNKKANKNRKKRRRSLKKNRILNGITNSNYDSNNNEIGKERNKTNENDENDWTIIKRKNKKNTDVKSKEERNKTNHKETFTNFGKKAFDEFGLVKLDHNDNDIDETMMANLNLRFKNLGNENNDNKNNDNNNNDNNVKIFEKEKQILTPFSIYQTPVIEYRHRMHSIN